MTIMVEVDRQTESQLIEKARARGMEVERYAAIILQAATDPPTSEPRATQDEFRAFLDAMAGHAPPPVPFDDRNWSRTVIYGDHD